jgi:hypothetical protein
MKIMTQGMVMVRKRRRKRRVLVSQIYLLHGYPIWC